MSDVVLDPKKVKRLFRKAHYKPRRYSGRGMFGRFCLGVDIDRHTTPFQVAVDLCEAGGTEGVAICRALVPLAEEDDNGFGTVLYFPRIEWPRAEGVR